MNVAVLECEHIGVDGQPGPGDYTRLFEDVLKRSRDAEDYHFVPVDARDGLPDSVHEYDAYLITGSYAGVYDQEPWIEALLQFVREAHAGSKPLVGICFGHQVIAHALGGRAEKAKVGWQLGVVSTKILAGGGRVAAGGRVAVGDRAGDGDLAGDRDRAGDGHLTGDRDRAGDGAGKGEPAESGDVVAAGACRPASGQPQRLNLVYMHQDQVVTLPPGARNFACTTECPYAGFTIGRNVFALQGHPEFTAEVADALIRENPHRYGHDLAAAARESLDTEIDHGYVAEWITGFLSGAHSAQ